LNSNTFGALFLDALYQVLDNKVFRVLAVLVLGLVACTFLIGAREDGLVLLFGLETLAYADIFSFFGMPYAGAEGAGKILVQSVQGIVVDGLAGSLGIMFAVAATAFFVPRMLEKGAADTLFSKPVGRGMLLFARYLAGLLFVAVLAFVLVGGMHIGFLVSSGYSDPGFLWSIVTLIYVFALLHGVSVLMGVMTRSTVASILMTLMFMVFNGCVHGGWMAKELFEDVEARNEDPALLADEEPSEESGPEVRSAWIDAALNALEVARVVLPKTTDAGIIARKLRADLERSYAELWDERGGLLIPAPPANFTRTAGAEALAGAGATWVLDDGRAVLRLSRRDEGDLSRMRASRALREELEARSDVRDVEDKRGSVADTTSSRVEWVVDGPDGERLHRVSFFPGDDCLYRFESEGTRAWRDDPVAAREFQGFVDDMTFNESHSATDPTKRFENLLGWDAPWRYNIVFSIGSSLVFLAAVLALAWWRLSRIDF
jgi:ABC-type transport system involved in multi-copper enzyme maturation permease subunit